MRRSLDLRLAGVMLVAFSSAAQLAPAHAGSPIGTATPSLPHLVQWEVGDARAYRLRSEGHTDVDFALLARALSNGLGGNSVTPGTTLGRTQSHYAIEATLHWRVVASDATGAILAARLADVDAQFDDATDDRTELLETPFLITVTARGAIHAFTFPKRYPEALAELVRGLVAPLAVELPDAAGATWTSGDASADGLFESRHVVTGKDAEGISVHRTRTPVLLPSSTQTQRGQASADLVLADAGMLEWLESTEDMTTQNGNAFVGRHVGRLSAARIEAAPVAMPTTLEEAQSVLADPAFARARFYDVEPRLVASIEGRTARVIVADFSAEVAKNQAAGHALLKNYLRHYPNASTEIAKALSAYGADSAELVVGFAALSAAGHREAQDALVATLTSPASTSVLRERAIISMMDLEMPETFVLDAVWKVRNQLAAQGPKSSLSLSIANNVYGALGDIKKGNAEITDEVLANLAGSLHAAADRFQVILALDALTNVGDFARVAPLAAPHFDSVDVGVRTAAFVTFRRMTGEAAFDEFAERFAREQDPAVLHEAALVAREMAPTTARRSWALRQLETCRDRGVLVPVVRMLGDEIATQPDHEAALRAALATTTDRQVRREIFAFVTPTTAGGHQ